MPEAFVYIYLNEGPVPAGILSTTGSGRDAGARFRYGRRYLVRPDRVAIDPVQLPLPDPGVEWDFRTEEGFSLFNGIRDAAPDGWGRHLIERSAGNRVLSEYDYLVATSEYRVGALDFGPDLTGPRRIVSWPEQEIGGEALDLASMVEAVRELDSPEDLPIRHRRFLVRGSSLGGARPKATTDFDGRQWIAKFGRADDRLPVCRAEFATMELARLAGITVPPTRLQKVFGQDIYMIERFDRVPNDGKDLRLPFISGLTILGAHESESSLQSYRRLAEEVRRIGSHPTRDVKELWRRMVFNILCNNTDDHLRNHGFLWDGRGWQLSPAYDILPFPQVGTERDLAIGVGKYGRRATIQNALTETETFGLSRTEGTSIAKSMQSVVRTSWEDLYMANGIVGSDLERLRTCFLACDEALDS